MCFINRISILSKNYNLFLKIIIFFIFETHTVYLYKIIIGFTTTPNHAPSLELTGIEPATFCLQSRRSPN